MSKSSSSPAAAPTPINPADYTHSPVHYAVATRDHTTLSRLLKSLPPNPDPSDDERISDQISAVLDRRDVPFRETPLHLSVRLNDSFAARSLATAGADVSLQNSAGWNPLQEALCRRLPEISSILLRLHHRSAWAKWRLRLPRLLSALRRMRDFYMEISFHFESSVIPFVGKIAPSDTYKIWKRDGNLRADTTLAGFDGLKIQRADQSFLFLGDGDQAHGIPSGSLLVLNHSERKIHDAFETAGAPLSESDIAGFCSQTSVYRPGMDVTEAQLVGRTNWRRQEKFESVGEWKARVYDVHNVVFSFRSRKLINSETDHHQQVLPLELDEDDDGFLVAENLSFAADHNDQRRRHSSFTREDREVVMVGRKSVDIIPSSSFSSTPRSGGIQNRRRPAAVGTVPLQTKEKEYVRSLRPSVWLTEQFPLKTEELLPLLDILANKVKAVRRMRDLLTTKFPAGTFPVKVAIPVVPTVRVVITFTKFVELKPVDQFYTPSSSPTNACGSHDESHNQSAASRLSSSWLRRSGGKQLPTPTPTTQEDPFSIPTGYTWTSSRSSVGGGNGDEDKSVKVKKSKSVRRSKASN
ncbi:Ankyrin repeat domain-containing protein 13C [Linum grandiflorum]